MEQATSTKHGGEPTALDITGLCLLSLDGGGVRGLSTLYILKTIMDRLNHERKKEGLPAAKPCEVFDLIGGTSTGGLIAIMLGRLEMDVEACITAYSDFAAAVFGEKLTRIPVHIKSNVRPRFDSKRLESAIKNVIVQSGASETDLLNDGIERGCRTFVCSIDRDTKDIVRLRSYSLPDEPSIRATICEAALATSTATTFFDPVSIGDRTFANGGFGANNPVDEMEGEAANIWCSETGDLKPLVKCFISIGTGNPGKKPFEDSILKFLSETVVQIATETEATEKKFIARWAKHFDEKRYFRFNVEQGLQNIGLEEYKKKGAIEAASEGYLTHMAQKFRVRDCIQNLKLKQSCPDIGSSSAPQLDFENLFREDEPYIQAFFSADYRSHRLSVTEHHPGTLDWFLNHVEFLKWLDNDVASPLWVSGNPGMGKTVLSLLLVQTFEKWTASQLRNITIYFFCSDQDDDRKSAVSILKALLHQCLQLRPSFIKKYVRPEHSRQGNKIYTSFASLWELFVKVTTDPGMGRVFCVIDALDECEETSRKQFLRQISNLFGSRLGQVKNMKLVLTSRPYESIRSQLFASTIIRLRAEQEEISINKDIAVYCRDAVNNLGLLRGYTDGLKEKVLAKLVSGADGMFLWVSLMILLLKDTPTTKVESRLQSLPTGIDSLYTRILQEVPKGLENDISEILTHVIFAFRPLTLLELAIARGIQTHAQSTSSIASNGLDGIRGDIALCGPLLKIHSDNSVHLVHQTAKDFLLAIRSRNSQVSQLVVANTIAHAEIARSCLSYLSLPELERGPLDAVFWYTESPQFHEVLGKFAFLGYAAAYWHRHIQFSEENMELWDALCNSLDAEPRRDLSFQVHQFVHNDRFYVGKQTPLHVLARTGLHSFLERLLNTDTADINAKDGFGWTALHWAAWQGHEAVAQLLRDRGADVTVEECRNKLSALEHAVLHGHQAVVRVLLDSNFWAGSTAIENALLLAASRGYSEIANLLLDRGAGTVALKGTTALHEAIDGKHVAVVDALLKRGVNIEARNALGQTALYIAACYGEEKIVRLLLEAGANVKANNDLNTNSAWHTTALRGAAQNKQNAVVKLLLQAEANFRDDIQITRALVTEIPAAGQAAVRMKTTPKTTKLGRDSNGEEGANSGRDTVLQFAGHPPVVGLCNLGSTGWLSAVVQLLISIPDLRNELLKHKSTGSEPQNLTNALGDLFAEMVETHQAFPPWTFFNALRRYLPQYSNAHALNDVEDFWHHLHEKLRQESAAGVSGCEYIETFMKGMFEVVETGVNPKAIGTGLIPLKSSTPFFQLTAFVDVSLGDFRSAILSSFAEQVERNLGMFHRSYRISHLPKYLLIHVHRYTWSKKHGKEKVSRKIDIPLELDATDFCTDELRAKLNPVRDKLKEKWKEIAAMGPDQVQSRPDGYAMDSPQVCQNNRQRIRNEVNREVDFEKWASTGAAEVLSLVDQNLACNNAANKSGIYELRGIITHVGQSAKFGTFRALVKQASENHLAGPEAGNWWVFDDHVVSTVTGEQVHMLASGGLSTAVLLLYHAVSLPGYPQAW